MKRLKLLIEYPEGFEPEKDFDFAIAGNLLVPGAYLLHEFSEHCWCEPELTHYDEDEQGWVCVHRTTLQ